jgi:outer membrane protein assembly factor BamB
MHRRRFLRLSAAFALAAHSLRGPATRLRAQPRPQAGARIFAANSYSGEMLPVYEITDGRRADFALLPAGGWIGPLVAAADSRLLAVTNAQGGALWDLTAGGDLTDSAPVAAQLFPTGLGYLEGCAVSADGTVYVANGEAGPQPVVAVHPDGTRSTLPGLLENPRGLAVRGGTLYAAEGSRGRVVAFDLATGTSQEFATGFEQKADHTAGQFAVDVQGRLLVLWATGGDHGLFDITAGGDFAGQPALVSAPFRIDVNQIAVDGPGNVYAAGDGDGLVYVSRIQNGGYAPFEVFARDLGDTESVAVLL